MTVEEYANKFIYLSRFAILVVGDKRERCRRFEKGLRFEGYTTITTSWHTEFAEVVKVTRRIEHNIIKEHKVQALKQKCSQSWLECGLSSKLYKRKGIYTNYFADG